MRSTRSATTRFLAALAAVLAVALIAPAFPAGAGAATTASVTTDCRNGEGYLHVLIEGSQQTTYDIYVDGFLVGDGVIIGTHNYGPYADGTYHVEVIWFPDGEATLLDQQVVIDCVPDVTTTAAPTTTVAPTIVAPTTTIPATTTTAPPAVAPITATPDYTG